MRRNQRIQLGTKLRQFSTLAQAGVAPSAAITVAEADNPSGKIAASTASVEISPVELMPASFPKTRARLAMADRDHQVSLLGAAGEILDVPEIAHSLSWMLYISVGGTAITLMLFSVFVAPAFQGMFDAFGADLPAPTMLAMGIAKWVLAPAAVLLALILVIGWLWKRQPQLLGRFSGRIDDATRRLPVFGRSMQVIQTQQLAAWLAACGTTGDVQQELECLVELAGPGQFGREVAGVAHAMAGGKSLADAVAVAAWLPGLALLLRSSPNNVAALTTYSHSLDAKSDLVMARLTLITQIVVGLIVGFFVIAMYLPIFKMGSLV